MAYDEHLAGRVRALLTSSAGVSEREMFGGIAFMLDGHMCCGVVGNDLMLRLGPAGASTAIKLPHVRQMDFTGRPMASMVFVGPEGLRAAALRRWVEQAAAFAHTLPPKR